MRWLGLFAALSLASVGEASVETGSSDSAVPSKLQNVRNLLDCAVQ